MMESAPTERTFATQAVHFVRTATGVNLTLSQMADQKASILMGATYVVFTLSVSQSKNGTLPLSMLVLAAFSLIAAGFAVMVLMPSFRAPHVVPGKENLLFFGVFSQLDEDLWIDQIFDRLESDETMFRTMLRDVWQNGQILRRKKYRFLNLSYRTFLVGLAVTFALFLFEVRAVSF